MSYALGPERSLVPPCANRRARPREAAGEAGRGTEGRKPHNGPFILSHAPSTRARAAPSWVGRRCYSSHVRRASWPLTHRRSRSTLLRASSKPPLSALACLVLAPVRVSPTLKEFARQFVNGFSHCPRRPGAHGQGRVCRISSAAVQARCRLSMGRMCALVMRLKDSFARCGGINAWVCSLWCASAGLSMRPSTSSPSSRLLSRSLPRSVVHAV